MGRGLGDQQLVIHAFFRLDGGRAAESYATLSGIWARCRDLLGVEEPITGLSPMLPGSRPEPGDPARPDVVLAALEEREHYRQMIVRRVQNIVNFSMVFTDKKDPVVRRRIGAATPPGWVEFDRWWGEMAQHAAPGLLDVVRLYLATTSLAPAQVGAAVRAAVPEAAQGRFWWERPQRRESFAIWEFSPEREAGADRRIAAVGTSDLVAPSARGELSDWAWSTGDPALPPLGRYLLHAAWLRAEARDWDGSTVDTLLDHARECIDAEPAPADEARARITAEREMLGAALARVRSRREATAEALAAMAGTLPEPLRSDHALAETLTGALREAEEELAAALRAVERHGRSLTELSDAPEVRSSELNSGERTRRAFDKAEYLRSPEVEPATDRTAAVPRPRPATGSAPAGPPDEELDESARVRIRMGFGVDVVGYSQRSHPEMEAVQRRLAELTDAVLGELGVLRAETDHQSQGDSMKVFLPADVEVHRTLPLLLQCWPEQLERDNRRHDDRIRIRMSVGVGPIGVAALGFAGGAPVEIARLLDCDLLRQAVTDHPESDLVVLISDELYRWAIVEWRTGVVPAEFQRVRVIAKDFDDDAWLWIAAPAPVTPATD